MLQLCCRHKVKFCYRLVEFCTACIKFYTTFHMTIKLNNHKNEHKTDLNFGQKCEVFGYKAVAYRIP